MVSVTWHTTWRPMRICEGSVRRSLAFVPVLCGLEESERRERAPSAYLLSSMAAAGAGAAELEENGEETRVCSESPNFSGDHGGSHDCSASSSPPLSGSCISWQCGADRMVKMEIDAAHALAEFAQLALLASKSPERRSGGFSAGKWGNKGRRSRKRCKNEASMSFGQKCFPESEDQFSNKDQYRHQKAGKNVLKKSAKVPQDFRLPKLISNCSTSQISTDRGKFKQNLSEVEKEARRLRRVQANRESARQTIRRRQALCEELTKMAADLAWDNEKMKQEKELATKEYLALKDRNKHLKEQVAKAIKCKATQSPPKNISSQMETQTSLPPPAQFPLVVYNGTPFTQFVWPSILQPFNPLQTQQIPQNSTDLPHGRIDFGGNSAPGNPFYLLPCPWFYPLTDQGSKPGSDSLALKERGRLFVEGENDSELPTKAAGNADNGSFRFRDRGKTSTSASTEATTNKENTSNSLTESLVVQLPGSCSLGAAQMPAFGEMNSNSIPNCDSKHFPDSVLKEAVSSIATCPVGRCSPENLHGASMYQSKKMVDAAAAAEARKRRKELTKLKNLHGKQFRLQC